MKWKLEFNAVEGHQIWCVRYRFINFYRIIRIYFKNSNFQNFITFLFFIICRTKKIRVKIFEPVRSDFRDVELGCYVAVLTVFRLFYSKKFKITQKQLNIFDIFIIKLHRKPLRWKYRMKVSGGTIRLFRLYHRLVKTCTPQFRIKTAFLIQKCVF